tara:strand:- start:438 stop:779 length:342 start_codon:yes stop_codon:yes gene_type:complete
MDAISGFTSIGGDPREVSKLLTANVSDEQKVAELARQFESVFVRQFLDEALAPMIDGAIEEGKSKNDIYRSFLTDALAEKITQKTDFGFSSALQMQLQSKFNIKDGSGSNTVK